MQINKEKLQRVASEAKAKAAGQKRWIAAIDKAVDGLLGGWIVTELVDGLMITTESGETYRANGECQCKAYQLNQPCKHRSAARLVARYRELEAAETASLHYETAPMVKPQPKRVDCAGWSI